MFRVESSRAADTKAKEVMIKKMCGGLGLGLANRESTIRLPGKSVMIAQHLQVLGSS